MGRRGKYLTFHFQLTISLPTTRTTSFFIFYWRIIALQYCVGLCQSIIIWWTFHIFHLSFCEYVLSQFLITWHSNLCIWVEKWLIIIIIKNIQISTYIHTSWHLRKKFLRHIYFLPSTKNSLNTTQLFYIINFWSSIFITNTHLKPWNLKRNHTGLHTLLIFSKHSSVLIVLVFAVLM